MKVNEVEFNPEFVVKMIPKLEWSALVQAAEEVDLSNDRQMLSCDCLEQSRPLTVWTITHFTLYKISVIDAVNHNQNTFY